MKIIDIVAPVKVKVLTANGPVENEITMAQFLVHQIDSYDAIKTREQVRQADKIVRLVEASTDSIPFEDADYDVVNEACKELRYIPEVKRQLIPFIDALEKTQDVQGLRKV